ncbi:uncharacterized protein LOC113360448 [Papaver somniferum]|uniref:uncharacterized protein LOC113360448 n=1 Tax=Papaver somniferum TaxID=3469 RepID=UPI000E6F5D09|nr:uncharacterized protein LOC113360448 [Papaver somniferum]
MPASVAKDIEKIMRNFLWGSSTTTLILKNGASIQFWSDKWDRNFVLKDRFSSIYKLSKQKKVYVKDMISTNGVWNFSFKRNLNEQKAGEIANLLHLLEDFTIAVHTNEEEDDRKWNFATEFSVDSCYTSLEIDGFLVFPHKQIWNPKIPLKVSFLVWCLCHNGAPTLEFLHQAGKVNSPTCHLCNEETENQETIKSKLWEWSVKKNRNMIKRIWGILPFAIWWTIWRERNNRVFNNKKRSIEQLIISVKYTLL